MISLTDQNFEETIKKSQKPILVDFFADWCPPCKILSPILEKLEEEYKEKVIFAKINVDSCLLASQKFEINPIPNVILFREGKPAGNFVGLKSEEEIKSWLRNLI